MNTYLFWRTDVKHWTDAASLRGVSIYSVHFYALCTLIQHMQLRSCFTLHQCSGFIHHTLVSLTQKRDGTLQPHRRWLLSPRKIHTALIQNWTGPDRPLSLQESNCKIPMKRRRPTDIMSSWDQMETLVLLQRLPSCVTVMSQQLCLNGLFLSLVQVTWPGSAAVQQNWVSECDGWKFTQKTCRSYTPLDIMQVLLSSSRSEVPLELFQVFQVFLSVLDLCLLSTVEFLNVACLVVLGSRGWPLLCTLDESHLHSLIIFIFVFGHCCHGDDAWPLAVSDYWSVIGCIRWGSAVTRPDALLSLLPCN